MSSEKEFTGIWRIISIPPRIFDWVLDHKLLTFLAIGAVYWGCGEINDILRDRAYERQKIEEQKRAEQQAAIKAERWKIQQVEIKKSKKLTFRNMPSSTIISEKLKKRAQESEQKSLEEEAISNAVRYASSSKPKLQPMPVRVNQLDTSSKR